MLILAPFLISTHFMLADVMTKPADKGTFVRMRNVMMNVHSGLRNSLVESAHALHGEALLLVQRLMSLHYDLTHVKEGALFLTHL